HFTMTRDSVLSNDKKSVDLVTDTITPSIWQPNKSNGLIQKITKKTILFKNATLWTNEEIGIVNSADIVISNGKIVAIGKNLDTTQIPNFENLNIDIVDASGKHITSGIIDEHSHIAISKGVNESSQAVTAEVSIADVINPDDHNIYRQIAGGVTCSQLLHGSANPIGGQSALIKLRWGSSAEDMKIKNCDGFIKFALGENVKQSNWGSFNTTRFPQTRMGVEQVFFDAFYRAKNYKKEWSNYNNLSIKQKRERLPPREDLELNTLVEILDGKRHITCHSYIESEINMLMHVADSMGFNINTFTHILEGYKIADKLKNHGAGASTFSDWWAYKFEVNDAIPYNAAILNQKGVITAINSDDAEMGRRLNHEAAKAVKYGDTSEEDAWKMITLNPAKLLHLDNRMGSLKVGKDADIVVWSENPLSIYAQVEQTYIDGNCYFDLTQNLLNKERDNREKIRIIKKLSKTKEKSKTKYKPAKEKLYHCDSIEHE
ncbi:amidohydrolase, partial [Flavobacteriales bacterium]|nr:amidohydrolase [Flavobacteriales bacterium]